MGCKAATHGDMTSIAVYRSSGELLAATAGLLGLSDVYGLHTDINEKSIQASPFALQSCALRLSCSPQNPPNADQN